MESSLPHKGHKNKHREKVDDLLSSYNSCRKPPTGHEAFPSHTRFICSGTSTHMNLINQRSEVGRKPEAPSSSSSRREGGKCSNMEHVFELSDETAGLLRSVFSLQTAAVCGEEKVRLGGRTWNVCVHASMYVCL